MRNWMLLVILFLVLLVLSTQAQDQAEPIYLIEDGVVYQWISDTNLTEIATLSLDNIEATSTSPDGTRYIIKVRTDEALQTIEEQCPCGGTNWPSDFFLIDLTDTAPTPMQITTQPDGARTFEQIVRSRPIWSPDSNMIAWTEGVEVGDLYIYDFTTAETRILAEDIPAQNLVSSPVDILLWTDAGIVIETVEYDDNLLPLPSTYTVYALDGNILETPALPGAEVARILAYTGDIPLLLSYEASLNLQTGELIATPPVGELLIVAVNNREASLRVGQPVLGDEDIITRQITDSDGTEVGVFSSADNQYFYRISPTGRTIFTRDSGDTLWFWRSESEGGAYTIESDINVAAWGRSVRIFVPGGRSLIAAGRCDLSEFGFRLGSSSNGYVADSTANNVRSEPDSDAELIGQIPAGDWFVMTGNAPVCADGFAWWEVEYGNFTGWTAESGSDGYWLVPGCPPGGCTRG